MQLDVLTIEGKQTGRTVDLPDEVFGIEPNDHVIYLAVKQHLAARHQGTHKVKGRSEVQGSSRKLHRQKGTGGSRKGNIRNPLYRGGGTVFGPTPHAYGFKMNRKEKDLAKMSALSYKATGQAIRIVEDLKIEAPKTSEFVQVLNNLEVSGKKVLFVTSEYQDVVYRSLRNLSTVKGTVLSDLNTYDIVHSNFLVFTEDAVKVFAERSAEETKEENKEQKTEGKKPKASVKEKKEVKKEPKVEAKEQKAESKEPITATKEEKEEKKEQKTESKEPIVEAKKQAEEKKGTKAESKGPKADSTDTEEAPAS